MAESKEELIRQAEAKYAREQLIAEAEAKWSKGQDQQTQEPSALEKIGQFGSDVLTAAETQSRSALEGLSLGMSEPVVSGINAFTSNLIKSGENPKDVASFLANAFDPEKISEAYQADVERRRQLKASMPVAAGVSELIGSAMPIGLSAVAAKPIIAATEAAGKAASASELGKKIATAIPLAAPAGRVASAAATGAGIAGSQYGLQKAVEEATGFVKPGELPSVSEAALLGAALPGGISLAQEAAPVIAKAAGKAKELVGSGVQKGIYMTTGLPVEVQRAYLKDPEIVREYLAIQNLPEGAGKRQAQVVLQERINTALAPTAESLQKAEVAAESIAGKVQKAEREMDVALASDVVAAGKDLKEKIVSESKKSYEILDKQKGAANFSELLPEMKQAQQGLLVEGQLLSEEETKAYNIIEKWMDRIPKTIKDPSAVPYPTVKRIVQSLDKDIDKYGTVGSAEFSDLSRSKLLEIRRILDSRLKGIDEYASQMETVYGLNKLRDSVNSIIGKSEEVSSGLISRVKRTYSPGVPEAETLKRLGAATGRDFSTVIESRAAMRPIRPATADVPPEYLSWVKSSEDAVAAESALQQARAVADTVKELIDAQKNFSAIRQMMIGRDPKWKETIKNLSTLSAQDFERQVNAARTSERFLMERREGSRSVNWMGAMFGGATMAWTGEPWLAIKAAGIGTLVGRYMDSYGPQVAQKFLDGYLKVSGIPTVSKITTAFNHLPDKISSEVVSQFARAVAASPQELFEIPKEERKYAAIEIQNSPSLTPMQKAKASNMVMNQGMIDADTMKLVMLSQPAELPMPQSAIERIFTPQRQARE